MMPWILLLFTPLGAVTIPYNTHGQCEDTRVKVMAQLKEQIPGGRVVGICVYQGASW